MTTLMVGLFMAAYTRGCCRESGGEGRKQGEQGEP